jgi:hypothetical protein
MKTRVHSNRATAYHEAGHAVIRLLVYLSLHRATIIPNVNGDSAGHVRGATIPAWIRTIAECGDIWEHPRLVPRALNEICALKAGHIAERCATGRANHAGASSDRNDAYLWLFLLTPEEARQEWLALDRWLEARTSRLVKEHWSAIQAVASALCERRSLTGTEVRRLVAESDPRVLPDRPLTRADRDHWRRVIAGFIASWSPEYLKAHLHSLPPGERRVWQQIQRDSNAKRRVSKTRT